jgi:integrase
MADGTIYGAVSKLSSFCDYLSRGTWNPVTQQVRPKAPRAYNTEKSKALTDEEVLALYGYLGEQAHKEHPPAYGTGLAFKRDWALFNWYLFTGSRLSSLLGLNWSRVSIRGNTITFRVFDKGGEWRTKSVSEPAVLEALKLYAGERIKLKTAAPIWLRHDRAADGTEALGARGFQRRFSEEHCLKAGIGWKHVHQIRHYFASAVDEESGGELSQVQAALDHAHQRTTLVYLSKMRTRKTPDLSGVIGKRLAGLQK